MAANRDLGSELVLDGVTLTALFTGNPGTFVHTGPLNIVVNYVKGDETSMEIAFNTSIDGVTDNTIINSADTSFTQILQLTASTIAKRLSVSEIAVAGERIGPILKGERYCKISVKATGGTPTGTCSITVIRG